MHYKHRPCYSLRTYKEYGSYLNYKNKNLIPFNATIFLSDLESFLHENAYASVDIFHLIRKYTNCKSFDEIKSIRANIYNLLRQLKDSGDIESRDISGMLSRSAGRFSTNSIFVKSTLKFEKDYKAKHIPPISPVTYNISTHGDFSPVAGETLKMGDIKINEEMPEQKAYSNKILGLTKKQLFWTALSVIIAVLLALLAWYKKV